MDKLKITGRYLLLEGMTVTLLFVPVSALRSWSLVFTSCFFPAAQAISSPRGMRRGVGSGGVLYLKPYTNQPQCIQILFWQSQLYEG